MTQRSIIPSMAMAILLGAAIPSQATQFGIADPRALAMGGAGVSAADGLTALALNPALLATAADGRRFAIGLPIYSTRTVDAGELEGDLYRLALPGQTMRLDIGDLNVSIAAGDVPQSQLDAARVAARLTDFGNVLLPTSDKSLDSEEFVGAAMAIPDRKLGIGIQVAKRTEYAASYLRSPSDPALLSSLSALAAAYAASGDPADLTALRAAMDLDADGLLDDPALGSRLRVRGLVLDEVSVSLATRLGWLADIDVGVTPKLVRATTIDYEVVAHQVQAEVDLKRDLRRTDGVNLDLGLAKSFDNDIRAGLTVRNLLRKSYATAGGDRIILEPQARAGISHHGKRSTVAIDLDLGENEHVGLGNATQFMAVGFEYGLGLVQLRAGYRHDLKGRYKDAASAGFGTDIAGLKLELGIAGNKNEVGGSVQIGIDL